MPPSPVVLSTVGALAVCLFSLWILSLKLKDASLVDPFWGPGFAVVAWVAFAVGGGAGPRPFLVLGLVTLWALRLGGYLLWRKRGHGEDFRYVAMRQRHGARFGTVSLFSVFLLQGVLLWLISLPLQCVVTAPGPSGLGALDWLGTALWAVGLFFEAVGDLQLLRFKADPAQQGQVCNRGLWRYTRHPNYFGDAVVWWGYGAFACATGDWATLLAPAAMTFLLVRVSGVALLERDIANRRPGYRDYIRQTSAFIPWRPLRAAVPPIDFSRGEGTSPKQ